MKEYVLAISEPTFLLCVGAIWVIIFLTIWKVLKQTLFKGNTAVIVALCVSLLSVISLSQLIAGGGDIQEVNNNGGRGGNILEFILLPYTVLGVAIILLLFIAFIAKIFRSERVKRYSEETKSGRTERPYPFESASEACEKSDEESHIRK
jgi:hypothetical protein